MSKCGHCLKFLNDGIGCPEDHDTYGSCSYIKKTVEPSDIACKDFISREKVTMRYDQFLDVLVGLNKAINACANGHGNGYLWRDLIGIETNLTNLYSGQHNLFEEVRKKSYSN